MIGISPVGTYNWDNYTNAASSAVAPADTGAATTGAVQAVAGASAATSAVEGGSGETEAARAQAEARVAEAQAKAGCQTCKERRYQDGSDDPGVSFQTPQHIDPGNAASVVMGHEMEHVMHEQAKAKQEGAEVVSQSVILHTSICPECGRTYVAGGVTKTVTAHGGGKAADTGAQESEPTAAVADEE